MLRLCRALVHVSAMLAPKRARARWREEWLAEIAVISTSRGSRKALRVSLGAPLDALSLRRTTRATIDRSGWRGPWQSDLRRGYFAATGLDIRRGRIFDASETLSAVVVDEKFVREHQLPEPVIGTVLRVSEPDGTARPVTIVGVVSERMSIPGVDDEERGLYAPLHQAPADRASVFIRTARPGVVAAETKAAMAQLDPLLAAMNVRTRGAGLRRDLESKCFSRRPRAPWDSSRWRSQWPACTRSWATS